MKSGAILMGVPVDDLTTAEAVDEIGRLVEAGRRSRTVSQVVTVNLDFVTNALRSAPVMRILQRAALSVADGMPIVWGARLLRTPLRERVAGADLLPALAERAAHEGWTIYLFGGASGAAEEAAEQLAAEHPGATVIGNSRPVLRDLDNVDPDVLDELASSGADVLCVALGNPKQELFIDRYGTRLGIPVAIGVGGTLDFLVGLRRRAPSRVQGIGLEWVFRMIQEPRRLGPRYARDIWVTLPRFMRQLARSLHRRPHWAPSEIDHHSEGEVAVRAVGSLDLHRDGALAALDVSDASVSLDLSDVARADTRTVAALLTLARASRGRLSIDAMNRTVRRRLAAEGVLEVATARAWDVNATS